MTLKFGGSGAGMRVSGAVAVGATAAVIAVPLLGLTWVADAANDKPWGPHATPLSYLKVLGVGLACALLIRATVASLVPPERGLSACMGVGIAVAAVLVLTFCVWWRDAWVMEVVPVRLG